MQGLTRLSNGTYVFRCYVGGKKTGARIKRVLGKVPAAEARALALALLHRHGSARAREKEPATVGSLCDEILYLRAHELSPAWQQRLETMVRLHIKPALGPRLVESLTPLDIRRYQLARLAEDPAPNPATVNHEVTAIKTILNQAVALGLLERNPLPLRSVRALRETPRRTWFEPHEWRAFLAAFDNYPAWLELWEPGRASLGPIVVGAASPSPRRYGGGHTATEEDLRRYHAGFQRMRFYFEALFYCAARLSEVCALDWDDVDLERRTLVITQEKTSTKKLVHVGAELASLLEALPHRSGAVFVRAGGTRVDRHQVQKAFALARKISGIRRALTVHSIRHTAGARLAEAGESARTIMEVLGHRSIRMAEVYQHLAPRHVASAFERLGASSGDPRATLPVSGDPSKTPVSD